MEFPRALFDHDAVQPPPPLSSPARGAPITSKGTVKEYDPEDTWGGGSSLPQVELNQHFKLCCLMIGMLRWRGS